MKDDDFFNYMPLIFLGTLLALALLILLLTASSIKNGVERDDFVCQQGQELIYHRHGKSGTYMCASRAMKKEK